MAWPALLCVTVRGPRKAGRAGQLRTDPGSASRRAIGVNTCEALELSPEAWLLPVLTEQSPCSARILSSSNGRVVVSTLAGFHLEAQEEGLGVSLSLSHLSRADN